MTGPARYEWTCPECGARIHLGDPIGYSDDHNDWVHASCTEAPHQNREPCPTCWLTTCDCEDGAAC